LDFTGNPRICSENCSDYSFFVLVVTRFYLAKEAEMGIYERKTFITSCCLLAVIACGTAFAQQGKITSGPYQGPKVPMGPLEPPAAAPFFTNLGANDACTSCNYSTANGFLLLGPNNCFSPGATQWLAYPFISTKAGSVRQVILAITNDTALCTPTSSKFTVAIYSDGCTSPRMPGTQLGTAVVATAGISPCTVATANFAHAGVTLVAGTTYWVVVTTSTASTQIATTAVWWETFSAESSVNFNDGNGWQASPLGGPGGFSVQ
jgi:hypothetical protein